MAIKRMPVADFVAQLVAALNRGDGYIMGATGQDPSKWSTGSWWFTQYSGTQKKKALYWREHAKRVWDCNGLAEGLYKDYTGTDINTRARYNYKEWCDPKGSGLIPAKYRVPGAAVFWGDSAGSIHHVAYLYKPVTAGKPEGDWYIIEARGVAYGVVRTKLYTRKPNFWGHMTKYFDYSGAAAAPAVLENGDSGSAVKEMQELLRKLGYDLGSWGVDGDFGDCTELAVRAFQAQADLKPTGKVDDKTLSAMKAAVAALEKPVELPKTVMFEGGSCYIRTEPKVGAEIRGVAKRGSSLPYDGEVAENGWIAVTYKDRRGWVSGKYGRLKA